MRGESVAGVLLAVDANGWRQPRTLGHFPMSENPAEFFNYLLPVLEKIGARGSLMAAK